MLLCLLHIYVCIRSTCSVTHPLDNSKNRWRQLQRRAETLQRTELLKQLLAYTLLTCLKRRLRASWQPRSTQHVPSSEPEVQPHWGARSRRYWGPRSGSRPSLWGLSTRPGVQGGPCDGHTRQQAAVHCQPCSTKARSCSGSPVYSCSINTVTPLPLQRTDGTIDKASSCCQPFCPDCSERASFFELAESAEPCPACCHKDNLFRQRSIGPLCCLMDSFSQTDHISFKNVEPSILSGLLA